MSQVWWLDPDQKGTYPGKLLKSSRQLSSLSLVKQRKLQQLNSLTAIEIETCVLIWNGTWNETAYIIT